MTDKRPEKNGVAPGGKAYPVLLQEVLELLAPEPGKIVADGTMGLGGHSAALARVIAPSGQLFAFDRDQQAIELARPQLEKTGISYQIIHSPFSKMQSRLAEIGVESVDCVLLDIGVSSFQLDTPVRGFSFNHDGPLDMRMSPESGMPTAAELVAELPEVELADILWKYGDERFSRRIAKRLVEARCNQTIKSTAELAELVRRAVPGRSKIDKATRTFQALRIAVNDELGELEAALNTIPDMLSARGRLAIISFHSLEDRLVKISFRDRQDDGGFRVITRKPVTATAAEMAVNPRSRSAKLRVLERTMTA